jgi:outer membrane protein assembly factor BamB
MNPGTGTSQYELVALNPLNGTPKWKLAITGTMVSEPVLGKDGKIFMTASDFAMNGQGQSGGMMNSGTSTTTSGKSRLLIVTPYPTTASITATITVDSDVLSAPRTAADGSGSYVIYATGFEMGTDTDAIASGQKTLYAFTPAGATKFTVKLN